MTYEETLDFLMSRLPMFQRIGGAAYKADLNTTIQLCQALGNPQLDFPSIHIAGTNGKGSVSHMLASILQEAGYKTGLYTSPHLKDFRERLKINGKMPPKDFIVSFTERNMDVIEVLKPSFFEMVFAMSMAWFSTSRIDIAVVETGMGGRLDSTNIVRPILSIITNISLDHTQFLGNTPEAIAREKAGIIKKNIPVIIGEKHPETEHVFREVAASLDAPLVFAQDEYTSGYEGDEMVLHSLRNDRKLGIIHPLAGNYQLKNTATVLAATDELARVLDLTPAHIGKGIENTVKNTSLLGRWQQLGSNPTIIADIGHNTAGLSTVMEQLRRVPFRQLHMVIGMVNDKDISGMLALLPQDATYYFCKADIPRGLDAEQLRTMANEFGLHGSAYPSVREAFEAARHHAQEDDLIFVGGSAFIVAEVV